jgi:hypothetical protein
MAAQNSIFESFYPTDWSDPTQSSQSYLILSLQHPARQNTGLMDKLFLPLCCHPATSLLNIRLILAPIPSKIPFQ